MKKNELTLIDVVKSKLDNTVKYVYQLVNGGHVIELSYINKNDGKNIICVPCQTMCTMGCKFCHTTDYIGKIEKININSHILTQCIYDVLEMENLRNSPETLLISFMGCGEPLENIEEIISTMQIINENDKYGTGVKRFAIATSLPKKLWYELFRLAEFIDRYKLNVKLHFSLHHIDENIRKEHMPKSIDVPTAFMLLDFYIAITELPIEIHYALMEGVNDRVDDLGVLTEYLKVRDFSLKLLYYNEKKSEDMIRATEAKIELFLAHLRDFHIKCEYYIPPGLDVGASCDQFIMEHYKKK